MGIDYFAAESSSAFSFAYLKAPNTAKPSQTKTLRWNLQVGALKIEDLSNISINYTKKRNPKPKIEHQKTNAYLWENWIRIYS